MTGIGLLKCSVPFALLLALLGTARADGELTLKTNCAMDEFAEINDPMPKSAGEFSVAIKCLPATCYYKKSGVFPYSTFSTTWIVVRNSDSLKSTHGGLRYAGGRALAEGLSSEAAAKNRAQVFVNQGLCKKAEYASPGSPNP